MCASSRMLKRCAARESSRMWIIKYLNKIIFHEKSLMCNFHIHNRMKTSAYGNGPGRGIGT